MNVTFLGTGTSVGVPAIGCDCATCLSEDPRDKRLRVSLLVEYNGHQVLIDPSTDFREQALRAGIRHLDAVLVTHSHADHVFGIDDLRPLNYRQGAIQMYANDQAWKGLRRMFAYVFQPPTQSSQPQIVPHLISGGVPFSLCGQPVTPLDVEHGNMTVLGFRFENFAYVTDCNLIPDASCEILSGLDVLILDCVRYRPHPTHLHLEESLRYVERLKPKKTYLTHIAHDFRHAEVNPTLPPGVELAYDGLRFEV